MAVGVQFDPNRRMEVIAGDGVAATTADAVVDAQTSNANLPTSEVQRPAGQPPVTVVTAFDPCLSPLFAPAQAQRPGATRNSETAPNFRGVLAVHHDGVVRRRAALALAL